MDPHADLLIVPIEASIAPPQFALLSQHHATGDAQRQISDLPLAVDLDGTLIATDTLAEMAVRLLLRAPWMIFPMLLWLAESRSRLKREISNRVKLNVDALPWKREVLAWVAEQRMHRLVYLVTAAEERVAKAIAEHLNLFDGVMATQGGVNLKGEAKRSRLEQEFGVKGFDYAGDSTADLPVWAGARKAILVGPASRFASAELATGDVAAVFPAPAPGWRDVLKGLRLYQWSKNFLVFIPVVLAHKVLDPERMAASLLAFLSLGCLASSIYLINDLIDLDSDRRHEKKRRRPFAAGTLPLAWAPMMVVTLWTGCLASAAPLAWEGQRMLLVYGVTAIAYTFVLKRLLYIDIGVLSVLYALRLYLGGAASATPLSIWLLGFSIFFFTSLAVAKRVSEMINKERQGLMEIPGRAYQLADRMPLMMMGICCANISSLVIVLYLNSNEMRALYRTPDLLWAVGPAIMLWVNRLWLLVGRGELDEDPIVFAAKDRATWLFAIIVASIVGFAA